MASKHVLGITDYVVVIFSLLVSAAIGLWFRFVGGRQKTTKEYLLANKNAALIPVIMSTTVTVISATSMLGIPSEVYRFGAHFCLLPFSAMVGMLLAAKIFLPVYFRCNISSIYEFLDMRFGKLTRCTVSALFLLQMVLYMSVVLYAPVLALSAVTEFSSEMVIILCGAICSFYCFMGGLKAVLWTDLFQSGLIILCMIIIYIVGIREVGGVGEIYRRASMGNRLQLLDLRFDFITRYTFWNLLFRGLCWGLGMFGASQVEVQRMLSLSGCKRAQTSLQCSSVTSTILLFLFCVTGLVLYAVFYLCDPVLMTKKTGLTKHDQLVPYFIIMKLKSFPGLTGLCIAGILGASLSSISSALNSAVTVTVIDFVQPTFSEKLSETKLVYVAKALSVILGIIFIGITFALSGFDSIIHINHVFLGIAEGPVLAIFLIGVLTRKASDKSATVGLVFGMVLCGWIGFGSLFSGYHPPTLPLENIGCPTVSNVTSQLFNNSSTICSLMNNCSSSILPRNTSNVFILYKMPFIWLPALGTFFSLCGTFIISLLIDRNRNMIPADSKCLGPVVRYWMPRTSQLKEVHQKKNEECCQENEL